MKIDSYKLPSLACIVGALLLTSCSDNDDNNRALDYDELQVNLSGTIALSEWQQPTEVGVFGTCTRNETPGYTLASNSLHKAAPGETSLLEISGNPIVSQKTDHNFKFQAYFPYREGVSSPTAIPVEMPSVQEYSQGADAYSTYVASTSVTTVVPTINLEFKSVGASIELNLADDVVDEEGNSRIRSITLKAPGSEPLASPLTVSGTYDLTTGVFAADQSTASDEVTLDFGANGITLTNANTAVYVSVAPFTIPQEGLVAEITDMDGKTLTTSILGGVDGGTTINAGDVKSCYLGRISDGVIPVTFPVEWPIGYANGAYIVSTATQPFWLTDGLWICPAQNQATIKWNKVSDPSDQFKQRLEFVNSSSAIGSPGVKGVWTGDYYELTLPVKRFAAGTALTLSFPMYTRQGPVFWNIEYLDGDTWKCNKSLVTAYDPNYKMDCTFSIIRGQTLVRHTMIFENAVKSGEIKIRITCADGSVQASADATCTVRQIPYTGAGGYEAPFYFYDKTFEMTSVKVSTD